MYVYALWVQEAQWQTGSGPADEDDGQHAAEGWSGSAEWGADWDLPGKTDRLQRGHRLLFTPVADTSAIFNL